LKQAWLSIATDAGVLPSFLLPKLTKEKISMFSKIHHAHISVAPYQLPQSTFQGKNKKKKEQQSSILWHTIHTMGNEGNLIFDKSKFPSKD
jgi:hypothetical protein